MKVVNYLLDLDLGVSADDTKTCARCVKQDSVKLCENVWELSSVEVGNNGVRNAETMQVSIQTLKTILLEIVCDNDSSVLHELGQISGFASWGSGHLENALIWLRG